MLPLSLRNLNHNILPINRFLRRLLGNSKSDDKEFERWIKSITGYKPVNLNLYKQAFRHSSAVAKSNTQLKSNERLEFLGDAILGSIVAEHLFNIYPKENEGFLTQLRSKVVNGQQLKKLAIKFGFDSYLKATLSKSETVKSSAFGDAFEAFIGAAYLDLGYVKTKKFVLKNILSQHVDLKELAESNDDFKSQLQIYCQKNRVKLEYAIISETIHKEGKLYKIEVRIDDIAYITFENFSKKVAEQKAAELTLQKLNEQKDQV